jgi:hypothetical protein
VSIIMKFPCEMKLDEIVDFFFAWDEIGSRLFGFFMIKFHFMKGIWWDYWSVTVYAIHTWFIIINYATFFFGQNLGIKTIFYDKNIMWC